MRYFKWLRSAVDLVREARAMAAEHGLSATRLVAEQVALYFGAGIDRHSYYQNRLFDPSMHWRDKTTYLPSEAYMWDLWKLLTPLVYHGLYRDKLLFKKAFAAWGFEQAPLYGVYVPRRMTASDLAALLRACPPGGFVFKPQYGVHGNGVLTFDSTDPVRALEGRVFAADDLAKWAGEATFLLEERLRPHAAIADLLGTSTLCTARIVTIVGLDGRSTMLAGTFRMPPAGASVDNMALGGLFDLDSGRLAAFGRSPYTFEDVRQTPVSERTFDGFVLPDWEAARDMVLRASQAVPAARAIGWDVGFTDRGPVIVEGNAVWSSMIIQRTEPHGLMRGEFKKLCDTLRSREPEGHFVVESSRWSRAAPGYSNAPA
jgi:hypothetical protein